MRPNNQSRPPSSVLTQQQILQIANELQQAQSQPQIKFLQSQIKHHLSLDKNINTMTSIILSRQTPLPTKQALISTYNLITQHLLQQYQLFRSKPIQYRRQFTPFSGTNDFGDDIKRNIMNLCGKMEKIVDNMFVPVAWKANLVYLQLRLYGRSKEDWDSARVGNKMEFYLRKDMIVVGGAFFQNSCKLGFSVKEKIDLVKKVGQHMPNILAKFMVKILRGQGMVQSLEKPSAYSDLSTSLNLANHILTTVFIQIPIQYLNSWYSLDPMIQTLKTLAQQIQSPTQSHPHSFIIQWQQLLPKILKKLMYRLLYYKKVYMYPNFVQFYSQYTKFLWAKYYLKNDINDNNYDGEILGLFQNGVKADQVGGVGGLKECFLGVGGGYTEVLSRDQKVFIIQQYVGKLLNFYHKKIEANLNNVSQGQEITQQLSDYMKVYPNQPQQSSINYIQLFLTLCQTYPQVISFLKNLIHCLLESYTLPNQQPPPPPPSSSFQQLSVFEIQDKQKQVQEQDEVQISKCWWLKQEIQLVCFLSQKFGRQWLLQCGMFLAIVCYRAVMADRRFLRVVDKFFGKISRGLDVDGCSIFGAQNTTLAVFLVFFNGYLQEIPLCVRSIKTSRITQYPLFPLITKISQNLSIVQPRLIYPLLLQCITNYITQISILLQTQKLSPTYISYNTTIPFPQLTLPFTKFSQLLNQIPIRFYTYLYPHILSCHIPSSSQFSSLNQIVSKIIEYRGEEQIGIEINKEWYIQYNKKIFNIFYIVVSHEEYVDIFEAVFDWVYGLLGGVSGNGLKEFGGEARELCVRVLGYPHIMAALMQTTKAKLWQIVYMLLSRYEWKPYTAQVESNQRSGTKLLPLQKQQKTELLLFHLTSTQPNLPPKLLHTLFQQSIQSLQKISSQIMQKKQNLKQTKHRHYQLQEICFLLCLHKLIANNCQGDGHGNGDRDGERDGYHDGYHDGKGDIAGIYVNSVLELVLRNFQYRVLCPEEFNYVNGKYGLLVVFMINYWFQTVWHNIKGRGQDVIKTIFHQTFFKDKWYRIQYDAPHYIINTVDIISKLWKQKTQLSNCEYILKYAHFAIGGCILCMDRIYQNYRYNRQQQLQIPVFNLQLTDPILQADTQTTKFLSYLCKTDPYIDQFKYFNNFLQKLRTNADVFYWFNKAMQIYIRTQVFMERFIQIFLIRKIQKQNGVIVYRVVRNIGQGSRLQKGWRRGWRDDDQFQFMPEILQEEERLKKLRAQGVIVSGSSDEDVEDFEGFRSSEQL